MWESHWLEFWNLTSRCLMVALSMINNSARLFKLWTKMRRRTSATSSCRSRKFTTLVLKIHHQRSPATDPTNIKPLQMNLKRKKNQTLKSKSTRSTMVTIAIWPFLSRVRLVQFLSRRCLTLLTRVMDWSKKARNRMLTLKNYFKKPKKNNSLTLKTNEQLLQS